MYTEHDRMQVGNFIPLKDGWFLDTETNTRFRIDEDGTPVDELGIPLTEYEEED